MSQTAKRFFGWAPSRPGPPPAAGQLLSGIWLAAGLAQLSLHTQVRGRGRGLGGERWARQLGGGWSLRCPALCSSPFTEPSTGSAAAVCGRCVSRHTLGGGESGHAAARLERRLHHCSHHYFQQVRLAALHRAQLNQRVGGLRLPSVVEASAIGGRGNA